jgi:2-polyprenyl-3-methyl-5-hydroxy-6-metoxy-1,4-benzoquinol methylase
MGVPPFIRIPAHVDGDALFAAAYRLERKLHSSLPRIDAALMAMRADYSGSSIPDPHVTPGYWPEWLHRKIDNVLSYLQTYAYIIAQAVPASRPRFQDLSLLDYGAGWGLMSLLAKEAGFGRVTYLDIDPGVTTVARTISGVIDVPIDDYICGAEDALHGRADRFDIIVSSDALEHIYDPKRAFTAIRGVCRPGSTVFHHTGANPRNVHQRFVLGRLHRSEEAKILPERERVIRETAPDLSQSRVTELAIASRGLDRADLLRAIQQHLQSGVVPTPTHPTNTCYLSGYWIEHLMEPKEVAREMAACGFATTVERSFWGPGRSRRTVRVVKHGLNFLSSLSTAIGLRVTFYYGIRGVAV